MRTEDIQSQALLQAIVQIAEDAIITLDTEQRIVIFNRGAERIFGYKAAEVLGKPLDMLIPERFRRFHPEHIRNFARSGIDARLMNGRSEILGLRQDGSEFPAEASISYVTVADNHYYSTVLRDVSRQKKQEVEKEMSLREKEVLLHEVHHRVKNNLQTISSLLSIHADAVDHAAVRDAFAIAQNRIHSIALVHEQLYRVGDFGNLRFSDYVKVLANSLQNSFQQQRISVCVRDSEQTLSVAQSIPCGLILNELITNAFKHAFPGSRKGQIEIKLETSASGSRILTVADDGIGLPSDFDMLACTTLGMQLVVSLAGQLAGNVELRGGAEGLTVRIIFPDTT